MKTVSYNGSVYRIKYKDELSQKVYTKRLVYYIKSDNYNYLSAKKNINKIICDLHGYTPEEVWSKGDYLLKNKQNPSIANGLHKYFEFEFDDNKDVYIYTLVEPYDD